MWLLCTVKTPTLPVWLTTGLCWSVLLSMLCSDVFSPNNQLEHPTSRPCSFETAVPLFSEMLLKMASDRRQTFVSWGEKNRVFGLSFSSIRDLDQTITDIVWELPCTLLTFILHLLFKLIRVQWSYLLMILNIIKSAGHFLLFVKEILPDSS